MFKGYEEVELIGEGGLGRVYRARRASTGGVLAIKELRNVSEGSSAWHRARRELEALLRLKGHPYVISVEEILEGPNGPCLVMEFAPGGSLMDRLCDGPLPTPEVVLIGQQVSEALSAAHALGIIHRDIKPPNLLIGSFGQVKVCDFGIASLARDDELRTKTSALTRAYASPEELDDSNDISSATDVYSFGATMYHLMTGRGPSFRDRMGGGGVEFGVTDPVVDDLLPLLRATMAHDPSDRPTAASLVDAFDRAAAGLGSSRLRALTVPAARGSAESAAAADFSVDGPVPAAPVMSSSSAPTVVRLPTQPVDAVLESTATSVEADRTHAVNPFPRKRWAIAAAVTATIGLSLVAFVAFSGSNDNGSRSSVSSSSPNEALPRTSNGANLQALASFPTGKAELSTFETLLEGADLVDELRSGGPFTVFEPTDSAFDKLPLDVLHAVEDDADMVKTVLLHHVVPGTITPEQMTAGELTTAAGSTLTVTESGGTFYVDGNAVGAGVEATNGYVYVMGDVLVPALGDIIDVAITLPGFGTLAALVIQAGLIDTLKGDGPFTVFAPADPAFAALPAAVVDTVTGDDALLTTVLTHHVIAGKYNLVMAPPISPITSFTAL